MAINMFLKESKDLKIRKQSDRLHLNSFKLLEL